MPETQGCRQTHGGEIDVAEEWEYEDMVPATCCPTPSRHHCYAPEWVLHTFEK